MFGRQLAGLGQLLQPGQAGAPGRATGIGMSQEHDPGAGRQAANPQYSPGYPDVHRLDPHPDTPEGTWRAKRATVTLITAPESSCHSAGSRPAGWRRVRRRAVTRAPATTCDRRPKWPPLSRSGYLDVTPCCSQSLLMRAGLGNELLAVDCESRGGAPARGSRYEMASV